MMPKPAGPSTQSSPKPTLRSTRHDPKSRPSNIPDDLKERVQFARDWWDDETRRLPGEERLNTVFVIEYYDGCKYFGYTKEYVAYRVATLSAYIGGWGSTLFVEQHARTVPYVVRCIESNLDDQDAKELRDIMVAQAPEEFHRGFGTTVQSPNCRTLGR